MRVIKPIRETRELLVIDRLVFPPGTRWLWSCGLLPKDEALWQGVNLRRIECYAREKLYGRN